MTRPPIGVRSSVEQELEAGVPCLRIPFRLDDPGVAPMLLSLRKVFPETMVSFPVVDYGRVPVESLQLARVPEEVDLVRTAPGEAAAVEAFYSKLLLPVELELLNLQDAAHEAIDRAPGLRRLRRVFAAVMRGRVAGACVVNRAAEGFWENAIEHLRVDPGLAPSEYEDVWNGLIRAAVCEVARHSDHAVSALLPGDRPLAVRAGLLTAQPEQYVVVSATRREDVYLRVAEHIRVHDRTLLAAA